MEFKTISDHQMLEMIRDSLLIRMTDVCNGVGEIIDTDEIYDLEELLGQYDEVCEKIRASK